MSKIFTRRVNGHGYGYALPVPIRLPSLLTAPRHLSSPPPYPPLATPRHHPVRHVHHPPLATTAALFTTFATHRPIHPIAAPHRAPPPTAYADTLYAPSSKRVRPVKQEEKRKG
ncbi:hypothetical protein GUJ93_ZPchr0010g10072 [Zizania palustris]|uniref:Uncharacterized protein n=1 Tax=Zizania palustris TaxID=103762 RepID=A0A8J6BKT6_ZIZPA|nr:hypothetical protein GUJ93_ZPchr0010g10072 [Zizania palustris]